MDYMDINIQLRSTAGKYDMRIQCVARFHRSNRCR